MENYYGSARDCEIVLDFLKENYGGRCYGVNILGDYSRAFALAGKYNAKFIQIDSLCGHLPTEEDITFGGRLNELRRNSPVSVLGGVRFKYQPILSGRSLEQDLIIGMERSDAIVVTGGGTGQDSPDSKIKEFRITVKDFPVIVGAGVTIDTIGKKLELADGIIIGSWLKENHRDYGDVSREYVAEFMDCVRGIIAVQRIGDYERY